MAHRTVPVRPVHRKEQSRSSVDLQLSNACIHARFAFMATRSFFSLLILFHLHEFVLGFTYTEPAGTGAVELQSTEAAAQRFSAAFYTYRRKMYGRSLTTYLFIEHALWPLAFVDHLSQDLTARAFRMEIEHSSVRGVGRIFETVLGLGFVGGGWKASEGLRNVLEGRRTLRHIKMMSSLAPSLQLFVFSTRTTCNLPLLSFLVL